MVPAAGCEAPALPAAAPPRGPGRGPACRGSCPATRVRAHVPWELSLSNFEEQSDSLIQHWGYKLELPQGNNPGYHGSAGWWLR